MPSTLVHAGVGLLLAVGLLGDHRDRKSLAIVVLVAVVLPEADTVAGLVVEGAHRTLLHNLTIAAVAGGVLAWETRRTDSWFRERFGAYGVRVAWTCLFVYAFAAVGLDWAHLEGVNLFWPVHDQFFRLEGEAYLSSTKGFVQTFVEIESDTETGRRIVDVGGGGTREEVHVGNPVQPESPGKPEKPASEPVERIAPVAVHGWQLYLASLGLFAVAAKRLQSDLPDR